MMSVDGGGDVNGDNHDHDNDNNNNEWMNICRECLSFLLFLLS